MANAGAQTKTKSAFDVMMAKKNRASQSADFDYMYSEFLYGYPERGTIHLGYRIRGEEIDPDITYEEFHEQYYNRVPRCASDEVFRDFWWYRRWDKEDDLGTSREFTYLRPWKHQRFGPGRTIAYDNCTPTELKRFVTERGLKDPFPRGVTLKYCYLRLLDEADKKFCFRFMDLPPEMRLMVYRNLLTFQPVLVQWRKDAQVEILRTSNQVYEEAKGVLYDDNVFKVHFEVTGLNQGRLRKLAIVHSDRSTVNCSHARYCRIPAGIDDYPDFFRRIAHLEIKLRYSILGTEAVLADGPWPLNHSLYTLASFLMDGHRLKSLRLDVNLAPSIEEWNYQTVFYPLRRLRNVPKVTIYGNVPANIRTKLTYDLKSVEPAFNTLRYWKLLSEEARVQRKLLEAVAGDPDCECGECYTSECIEELDVRMGSLDDAKGESCFRSRLEENFIARLSMFRDTLKTVDTARVKRLVKTLIEKRTATKEYESVTDDGRLEEAAEIWAGNVYDADMKYGDRDEDWDVAGKTTSPKSAPMPKVASSTSASSNL